MQDFSDEKPHKNPLLLMDDQGVYERYSIEEVIARDLHNWENWLCAAGTHGLYVDFDGEVWGASCKQGQLLGNIWRDFELPDGWIQCHAKRCVCGADMLIPKVRSKNLLVEPLKFSRKEAPQKIDRVMSSYRPEVITPLKRVVWNIGRRCNYSCSYCHPNVHNKTEDFKSADQFINASQKILDKFSKASKTRFYFAGGEPTLYPEFNRFLKFLVEHGHEVSVVSNGSHRLETYAEILELGHLTLSIHFEFSKDDVLAEKIKKLIRVKLHSWKEYEPISRWLDIKLMVAPGGLKRAIKFASNIFSHPGYQRFATLRFQPLWLPDDPNRLYPYSKEELRFFEIYNRDESINRLLSSKLQQKEFISP